ncbi:MAG: protein kinase [Anaerolineales bacterium]|nr:protein kinase [Anaerolineales bacterium]
MPFVVGENIGPYRIVEQLGRGGMATVFKAYHAALDRFVALKALHPAFMEDPNFLARFQREARVVARLEHPQIVPIYDFAEHEGRPYLVMKFIAGETLKARLQRGALEQAEMLAIVEAIAAALSYAHQQGILHRDVKPSNVLLTEDGKIYLADFGLARIAQAGESTLSSDMMLGTPQYISPEQAMGLSDLNEGTDIYSFGVMLYELVVGKVPFSADTPFSIIHDHIYKPLPLPRTVNPGVAEEVERVLLKALAKERADRYESASLLAIAFKAAISGHGPDDEAGQEPVVDKTFLASSSSAHQLTESKTLLAPVDPPASATTLEEPPTQVLEQQIGISDQASEGPSQPMDETEQAVAASILRGGGRWRRWRWWQILIAGISFCCCLLLAIGIFNDIQDGDRPLQQTATARASILQNDEQAEPPVPVIPLDQAEEQVAQNAEDPFAQVELAVAAWDSGDYERAEAEFERAAELADGDPEVFWYASELLSERQAWILAARIGLQAIHFAPQVPKERQDFFHMLVFYAAEMPNAQEEIPIAAIAEVDIALERVVKARYFARNVDFGQAWAALQQALELDPGMPEALVQQAELQYQSGERQLAIENLDRLLVEQLLSPWLKDYVVRLLEERISRVEAAQKQIDQRPEDPWAHLALFDAYLVVGDYEAAELALQQAVELAQGDPAIFEAAGDIMAREEVWLYAATLYRMAINLLPEKPRPELLDKYDQSLYYGALADEALEVLSDPELGLPEPDLQLVEARQALYHENFQQAKDLIESLRAENPDLIAARLVEAEIYLRTGDGELGRMILEEIMADENVPAWLRNEAQGMYQSIP